MYSHSGGRPCSFCLWSLSFLVFKWKKYGHFYFFKTCRCFTKVHMRLVKHLGGRVSHVALALYWKVETHQIVALTALVDVEHSGITKIGNDSEFQGFQGVAGLVVLVFFTLVSQVNLTLDARSSPTKLHIKSRDFTPTFHQHLEAAVCPYERQAGNTTTYGV